MTQSWNQHQRTYSCIHTNPACWNSFLKSFFTSIFAAAALLLLHCCCCYRPLCWTAVAAASRKLPQFTLHTLMLSGNSSYSVVAVDQPQQTCWRRLDWRFWVTILSLLLFHLHVYPTNVVDTFFVSYKTTWPKDKINVLYSTAVSYSTHDLVIIVTAAALWHEM